MTDRTPQWPMFPRDWADGIDLDWTRSPDPGADSSLRGSEFYGNTLCRWQVKRGYNNLATLLKPRESLKKRSPLTDKRQKSILFRRWDAHQKAALLLYRQGRYREAVEHYRSAVQINPGATEARAIWLRYWLLMVKSPRGSSTAQESRARSREQRDASKTRP